MGQGLKKSLPLLLGALVIGVGIYAWLDQQSSGYGEAFVSGNGRIEATEVDVATKLPGRVETIFADEGDLVMAGEPLAQMQISVLEAQRREANAQQQQAVNAVATADAQVAMSESNLVAVKATVQQRLSELKATRQRYQRSVTLAKKGNVSQQQVDDDLAALSSAEAAVRAAEAQVKAAESAIVAARAQAVGARTAVTAAEATVARIEADIEDSILKAPRNGRVQYRVAQPGEILGAGGVVLNLVDLTDVYMTFFLPETIVGRVRLGSEARILIDAAPHLVIPAKVSFVASTAQFTPKSVETATERQKLMFRVKARIDPELLSKHLSMVKTGVPGVTWLKLDDAIEWPEELAVKVPE